MTLLEGLRRDSVPVDDNGIFYLRMVQISKNKMVVTIEKSTVMIPLLSMHM